MTARGFALFDTPIGRCGVVWGAQGLRGVQFPEVTESETRRRLLWRTPDAREGLPPPDVQHVLDDITALLHGEPRDLSSILLDWERVPSFDRRVYEVTRSIPPGTTLSYGDVGERLGARELARDVGQALGRNPFAIIVPCHRVLAAGGKLGGFSTTGGVALKERLLFIEGARTSLAPTLF